MLFATLLTSLLVGRTVAVEGCAIVPYELRVTNVLPRQFSRTQLVPFVYVDSAQPRMSWKLARNPAYADTTSSRQQAYQIFASTSLAKFDANVFDAWDSGVVTSNSTLQIVYNGTGLSTVGSEIFWSVQVTDATFQLCRLPSPVSIRRAPSGAPGEWGSAAWITATNSIPSDDCGFYENDPAPLLRKEFGVGLTIDSAHLYISGLGFYTATLNGVPVSESVLDPAWTTYDKRTLYSAFDVTTLLTAGESNVLGVTLGKGYVHIGEVCVHSPDCCCDKHGCISSSRILPVAEGLHVRDNTRWNNSWGDTHLCNPVIWCITHLRHALSFAILILTLCCCVQMV